MKDYKKYFYILSLIVVLTVSYFIADSLLFNGVKPQAINKNGFQGTYFTKDNEEDKPAIIIVGGGQWGDYWAHEFALNNMTGLSLPYTGKNDLPTLPEEIELEYFLKAIIWLKNQKGVDHNKIIVMGASRNAELAMVLAATFPNQINGVIAYAPSSVSWSNTVLPYNSNELKPSWKYKGKSVPYIPMEKLLAKGSTTINMLEYWENGLSTIDLDSKALIPVDKINGPILMFSGTDDEVWPSAKMADMIEERLNNYNFQFPFKNIQYENAGHLISNKPFQKSEVRIGTIVLNGKNYKYNYGGTTQGDFMAKNDAYEKVFEFLNSLR